MDCLEQGKQNLWLGTDGHCTKCVSSSLSWHNVHLRAFAADSDPSAEDGGVLPCREEEPDGRRLTAAINNLI